MGEKERRLSEWIFFKYAMVKQLFIKSARWGDSLEQSLLTKAELYLLLSSFITLPKVDTKALEDKAQESEISSPQKYSFISSFHLKC